MVDLLLTVSRCRAAAAAAILCLSSFAAAQGDLDLRQAFDLNPHPKVFETVLVSHEIEHEFQPGVKSLLAAYNGTLPGPTIDAKVGDTLIVHFYNGLTIPSTVHWHGVEMPATMDGSHISQGGVPPNGYFRYQFKLLHAGTFWYHPHINTNQMIERGLYGALIVRDPAAEARLGIPRSREAVVFLDEILLDANGKLAPFATDPNAQMKAEQRADDLANSRLGNFTLINGHVLAPNNLPTLETLSGGAYRIRFINVSSGATFRMDLSDDDQRWFQLGSDQGFWNEAEELRYIDLVPNPGHHPGLVSNPHPSRGLMLTPGDRCEVAIVPKGARGDEFYFDLHDLNTGKHVAHRNAAGDLIYGHAHFDGMAPPRRGMRIRVGKPVQGAATSMVDWVPPVPLRPTPIQRLQPDLTKDPLPVFFGHSFPHRTTGDVMFFMNVARPFDLLKMTRAHRQAGPMPFGPRPFPMLKAADGYHVKVGDTHYFEIVNFTGGDHNFHTHGFRFQHIDTTYVDLDAPVKVRTEKPLRLTYEDTIRIPRRPAFILTRSYTIVRLAVRFDDADRPAGLRRAAAALLAGGLKPTGTTSGGWLVHCHFLEHAAKGMLSFITVTR